MVPRPLQKLGGDSPVVSTAMWCWKYILFTYLVNYVDINILACFHMYIHVGMRVDSDLYMCELCTCIITFTHTCSCEENLILGGTDEYANAKFYEN